MILIKYIYIKFINQFFNNFQFNLFIVINNMLTFLLILKENYFILFFILLKDSFLYVV